MDCCPPEILSNIVTATAQTCLTGLLALSSTNRTFRTIYLRSERELLETFARAFIPRPLFMLCRILACLPYREWTSNYDEDTEFEYYSPWYETFNEKAMERDWEDMSGPDGTSTTELRDMILIHRRILYIYQLLTCMIRPDYMHRYPRLPVAGPISFNLTIPSQFSTPFDSENFQKVVIALYTYFQEHNENCILDHFSSLFRDLAEQYRDQFPANADFDDDCEETLDGNIHSLVYDLLNMALSPCEPCGISASDTGETPFGSGLNDPCEHQLHPTPILPLHHLFSTRSRCTLCTDLNDLNYNYSLCPEKLDIRDFVRIFRLEKEEERRIHYETVVDPEGTGGIMVERWPDRKGIRGSVIWSPGGNITIDEGMKEGIDEEATKKVVE